MFTDEVTQLNENERIYNFPNNEKVVLKNVRKLIVRDSGTHRLETADGKKHIIAKGWLSIEIDSDNDWVK